MSCDLEMAPTTNGTVELEDEDTAYEPTYEEAFPPLAPGMAPAPGQPMSNQPTVPGNSWNNTKFSIKRSTVTQVFCVPMEERKFSSAEATFGTTQQNKICQDIMNRTGVAIEMSTARDHSLTVVVTGKTDMVMRARKLVVQQLQTQARAILRIPKEHHKYILGAKGKRLQDLELATATKINIPRVEENSDEVTIVGTKEGIESAQYKIQSISDEQAKLAFERLDVPKIYHPFVCGPDNKIILDLEQETGSRIRVPPPSVDKNEIIVSGEKDGVATAIAAIMKIYKEKEKRCGTVSVEVRKSQHKYVIGPRGANLSQILEETGVSVEVPKLDETSDTITLRGEQDKLAKALSIVYDKANSVITSYIEAPAWIHKFIIGRKGAKINKITSDFPKIHVEFQEGKDKIELEGPPADVEGAEETLNAIVKDLIETMAFAELQVDQKYHRHIIGSKGSNVNRLKEETGVTINIPNDGDNSNVIRIEGPPAGVATARKDLEDMVFKMENEKSRDILIEQRFHKTIIGQKGVKIGEIRDRFNQVQINFPDSSARSEVVTLRGPKNDVDKCYLYLQKFVAELIDNNYQCEVHIYKEFHKNIIGKGGNTIRKIRDETETRIDLPSESSESDTILITGKKAKVEEARRQIEAIQKELGNIQELTIEIPSRFHNSIIGAKGRLIRSVMDECGGVTIRFPPAAAKSDKVLIRGPKEDVEKARQQLMELSNERQESGHTVELQCKRDYHRFLIGKGGANVRHLRETTGARVIFPAAQDQDPELIVLMGTPEQAEAAKKELEERIRGLENVTETVIDVNPKWHRHFVIRRGEVLRQIGDEFGGVTVSFPRSGTQSEKVVIKGAADCVEGAKNRILEIVEDLESQVSIECVIPQKFHRTVMGQRGSKVQQITADWDVGIKFPDRPQQEQPAPPAENGDADIKVENGEAPPSEPVVNGDSKEVDPNEPSPFDIITISGRVENCEGAKAALLAQVPITKEVNVAVDFHRFIIGQKGRDVRQMMDDYDVNISVPAAEQESDIIRVTGAPCNVDRAEQALHERVEQLEQEKLDRLARSFEVKVEVNPIYHPKIIGRKGAVITKIRTDHNVNIHFVNRGGEADNIITITGYETDANNAKHDILNIVKELEDQTSEEIEIDHRVHPRIIGGRGRNIRKLMEQYKVDIKFPPQNAANPDLVVISGAEDDVFDCKDHLMNLEEEFLQDITDNEVLENYSYSAKQRNDESDKSGNGGPPTKGFVVKGAPWSTKAPDVSSDADFPAFGNAPAASNKAPTASWGPWRK